MPENVLYLANQLSEMKPIIIGLVGFLVSMLMDNSGDEPFYEILKYAALIIPILFTIWRWIREIRKSKKK